MKLSAPLRPLRPEQRMLVTSALVRDLETMLEMKLPHDYLSFLVDHGGSLLGDDLHYVAASILAPCPLGESVDVEVVYGFYSDPSDFYDLRDAARAYKGKIPSNCASIGSTIGQDQIVLSCSGLDQGSIYLWDHQFSYLRGTENIRKILQDLEDDGVNTRSLDLHRAVMAWDDRHAEILGRPPGYGPLYLLASSFPAFLDALKPMPYEQEDAE
jgi:SMI1 / KNR4 family (SUKH-1)